MRFPVLPHLVQPTPRTARGQGQLSSSHALGAGSPSPMLASGASSAVFLRQGTEPALPSATAREAQGPTSSFAFMTLGLALLPAMGRNGGRVGTSVPHLHQCKASSDILVKMNFIFRYT